MEQIYVPFLQLLLCWAIFVGPFLFCQKLLVKLISKLFWCIRRGYNVVMTTSLSSDVPVGYFSWAEYDIMAPVQPKTEKALAAAFISNCGARNFRLQALEELEKLNIKIDSYGGCHRNRDGRGTALSWIATKCDCCLVLLPNHESGFCIVLLFVPYVRACVRACT